MRSSAQRLKEPERSYSPVAVDLQKHFMMVSPLNPHVAFMPTEFLDSYAKWETLRRALKQSGADVTAIDARQKNSPEIFACRDSFIAAGGVILLPDQDEAGSEIRNMMSQMPELMSVAEKVMGKDHLSKFKAKRMEYERIERVLEDRDERIGLLNETSIAGGNVIADPITKSLFIGARVTNDPECDAYDDSIRADIQHVLRKMTRNDWTVHHVPLCYENNSQDDYKEYIQRISSAVQMGKAQMIYHLDLGMSEPLANGEMIICPDMTFPENYQAICDIIGKDRIIEITHSEALDLSANLVSHGHNIFMSRASHRLRDILEDKGYNVFESKDYGLNSFVIADSGPHCLTNTLSPN